MSLFRLSFYPPTFVKFSKKTIFIKKKLNQSSRIKPMENLKLCINSIQDGKCILFLGPQFAMDKDNQKIHLSLKKHLKQQETFKSRLDFSYDNLFIFNTSKPKSVDRMRLNMEIKDFYQSKTPHPLYEKIPKIPFSAIVSCSPDVYLKDAFGKNNVNFKYFSYKGTSPEKNKNNTLPLLYNVFGCLNDKESLINTYEHFFQFFISIMGEEHQIPLELQNRLVDANFYVFIGFDMRKWYIPLLIHKLNSFKDSTDYSPALLNKDNITDESTPHQLPLELLISDAETEPFMNALSEYFIKKEANKSKPKLDKKELENIENHLLIKGMDEWDIVFKELERYYLILEKDPVEVKLLRGDTMKLKIKNRRGTITSDDLDASRNQLTEKLLTIIQELESAT